MKKNLKEIITSGTFDDKATHTYRHFLQHSKEYFIGSMADALEKEIKLLNSKDEGALNRAYRYYETKIQKKLDIFKKIGANDLYDKFLEEFGQAGAGLRKIGALKVKQRDINLPDKDMIKQAYVVILGKFGKGAVDFDRNEAIPILQKEGLTQKEAEIVIDSYKRDEDPEEAYYSIAGRSDDSDERSERLGSAYVERHKQPYTEAEQKQGAEVVEKIKEELRIPSEEFFVITAENGTVFVAHTIIGGLPIFKLYGGWGEADKWKNRNDAEEVIAILNVQFPNDKFSIDKIEVPAYPEEETTSDKIRDLSLEDLFRIFTIGKRVEIGGGNAYGKKGRIINVFNDGIAEIKTEDNDIVRVDLVDIVIPESELKVDMIYHPDKLYEITLGGKKMVVSLQFLKQLVSKGGESEMQRRHKASGEDIYTFAKNQGITLTDDELLPIIEKLENARVGKQYSPKDDLTEFEAIIGKIKVIPYSPDIKYIDSINDIPKSFNERYEELKERHPEVYSQPAQRPQAPFVPSAPSAQVPTDTYFVIYGGGNNYAGKVIKNGLPFYQWVTIIENADKWKDRGEAEAVIDVLNTMYPKGSHSIEAKDLPVMARGGIGWTNEWIGELKSNKTGRREWFHVKAKTGEEAKEKALKGIDTSEWSIEHIGQDVVHQGVKLDPDTMRPFAKGGVVKISEDDFHKKYKPQINHIERKKQSRTIADEDLTSWSGTMYETYGEDLDYIVKMAKDPKTSKRVWTLIEGDDGNLYRVAGYHLVNRQGYMITEKEWKTGTEEVIEDYAKGGKTSKPRFVQGVFKTSEQEEVNSMIMEIASYIADKLTRKDCRKRNIKCDVREDGMTSYTDKAQDIHNDYYDQKMEEVYEAANTIKGKVTYEKLKEAVKKNKK